MNIFSWLQLIFYMVVLIALAKPLGLYMTRVYQGERTFLDPVLRPVEKFIYRISGVKADEEMSWKVYAIAMLLFNGLGLLAVWRIIPRIMAIKTAMPVAAETKFWVVNASIWVR